MANQSISDMAEISLCRVKLSIQEETVSALRAVTTDPDASQIVAAHTESSVDAYYELKAAEHHASSLDIPEETELESPRG